MIEPGRLRSSFRDPSGFVYEDGGVLLRQVNAVYAPHFDRLIASGLYDELAGEGLLVSHEDDARSAPTPGIAILRPARVPFISYPYEWCFGQLKDAALATLEIQRRAIGRGMTLKDASAYNVQFLGGKPTLIDTLSFETYEEGKPWIAYRQFCQHFLAPLALMARVDPSLSSLSRIHLDGVPLDLASKLLPYSTRFKPGLLFHLHLHAKAQKGHANDATSAAPRVNVTKTGMLGLIDSLRSAVEGLTWEPQGTEWGDYYGATNYTDEAFQAKRSLVATMLDRVDPQTCWDLGANTGEFSRLAAERGASTVAWDIDPAAVEKGYRWTKRNGTGNLLPLVVDLTNPSPALGWAGRERESLTERGPVDTVLALALIHHLAISNNVPLTWIAEFFATLGRTAVVEFVPKQDSQVRRLLATREDVFPEYHEEGFVAAIAPYFETLERAPIPGTSRTLFLLRRKVS